MTPEFLRWRGVEAPCKVCGGRGVHAYASTATWRGGMGGQAMTRDVCDRCWGTGDRDRYGADLRALESQLRVAEVQGSLDLLARSVGAGLRSCRPALEELCAEIDRLGRGRKVRAPFFRDLATALARTIREGIGE